MIISAEGSCWLPNGQVFTAMKMDDDLSGLWGDADERQGAMGSGGWQSVQMGEFLV
jgi:hypothetical protein